MRDISSWRKSIMQHLKPHWSEASEMQRSYFCNIELGLYLLSQVAPDAPAHALWVLLTGYPFSVPVTQNWAEIQRQMLGNARHILPYFRSEFQWRRALERYRRVGEQLRCYEVDSNLETFRSKPVSIASHRAETYISTLKRRLAYRKDSIKWVTEGGIYIFTKRKYRSQVDIPQELVLSPPESHNLDGQHQRHPLTITWTELLDTAHWMDTQLGVSWYADRLNNVQLELFDRTNTLNRANELTLDGLTNLVGMVSSGKSTLMKILTVWAVRKELRITLVVGDVIGALGLAELFARLQLSVAPILGQSNRHRHTNRLHKVLSAEQVHLSPLQHQHVGFRWLSTACPLDGLCEDEHLSFNIKEKLPCLELYSPDEKKPAPYACPLYNSCPFHQAQRDLVNAKIWIATPASLVYTRVAKQINAEHVRFLELVYRCSDLVIVDEADQVQVQLDMTFSPNQTLVSQRQEGWLDSLSQQVVKELSLGGRGQLANEQVDIWHQANETAQVATNKIYGLLLRNTDLHDWVGKDDCFTDWTLFEKLSNALIEGRVEARQHNPEDVNLPEVFQEYLEDPLGERSSHPLATLSQQCITMTTAERVREQIVDWIKERDEFTASLSDDELAEISVYFEFTLLVSVLQDRINLLIRDWKQVEDPLKLEGGSSMMFNRPPKDYEAVIPVSPMGNVLAFQYIRPIDKSNAPGDLRFFRCMGVGRWLLLHLHELFRADNIAGPHVLLLSGSSWAGMSPGYHIQAPVSGILRSPEMEIEAIERSTFKFEPFYDDEGCPIKVSGRQGRGRIAALKNILGQLARKSSLGGVSQFEQERDDLPPERQRILILVGSYDEARRSREYLEQLRTDWDGYVLNLVPDDDEFESDWRGAENKLQRGLVHSLADTEAWILIAPLLAIERGHNILNKQDQAAIGAAYFLVRPHPRPDDISFAIHSINRWAIERSDDTSLLRNTGQRDMTTLHGVGKVFRNEAYRRWRYLLHLPMVYSSLKSDEREVVTWNQLVTIWQVIGRLIRGGSPARIYFCDAAFAPGAAGYDESPDQTATSLLINMKHILRPYFSEFSLINAEEKVLVQALYGPFYQAIEHMEGLTDV